jgi:hypothetical protein
VGLASDARPGPAVERLNRIAHLYRDVALTGVHVMDLVGTPGGIVSVGAVAIADKWPVARAFEEKGVVRGKRRDYNNRDCLTLRRGHK